LAIANL